MRPDPMRDEIVILRDKWQNRPSLLYRELSDLLLRSGKISAAMNLLEKSLLADSGEEALEEFGPEEGSFWFRRGLEYADACLYEEACFCLNRALEAGCENFEAHYCLAGVFKSLLKLDEATLHCRKSIEYNSKFAPAYILLGSIAKLKGLYDEGASAAKKALMIDPDCAPAHYDLACYYALSQNIEPALAAFEMALTKGFCDFEWASQDPDLGNLQTCPEFLLLLKTYSSNRG